jgi:hypothetical protein
MADLVARHLPPPAVHRRLTMRKLVRRKSTVAFFMCLPLILVVGTVTTPIRGDVYAWDRS